MEDINKPLSLMIHDCKDNIIEAINKHSLPPSIMVLLLRDIMTEMEALDRRAYMEDLESYKKDLDDAASKIEENQNG